MIFRKLTVFALLQLSAVFAFGQIQDTIIKADSVKVGPEKGPVKDSLRLAIEAMPRKAALRSAIIPGWGQYYNKGLWWIKVPAIYGGFGTLIGIYLWNQDNYKMLLTEAQFREANPGKRRNPRLVAYDNGAIIQYKDLYRRDRDLTIIGTAGWYALNIIEAYVDAKFFRFDISDDLSLKVTPSLQPQPFAYANAAAVPSLKIRLSLNQEKKARFGLSSYSNPR